MTLLVRDEEDVIESNILYHLSQGVDFIIATDNNSIDTTPEVLERYASQGVLHLIREHSEDWHQEKWVTRMARMAATDFGADWVINNDADEFWWPRMGTLKDVFAAVPEPFRAVKAPRLNFIPRPDQSGPFWERMVVAEMATLQFRRQWEVSPLKPKVAHRASPEVVLGRGNHKVYPRRTFLCIPGWQPILIFHYPLRTYAQFEARNRLPESVYTHIPPGERTRLAEFRERGTLSEFWSAKVLDDEAVEVGIRECRVVVDRRIEKFMRRIDGTGPEGSGVRPRNLADAADLRLDACWAINQARRAKKQRERRKADLAEAHTKLAEAQKKAERAQARADRAEARKDALEVRVEELESSLFRRLGRRLSSLRQ